MVTQSRALMSTIFLIRVLDTPEPMAERAIGEAFREIERLEGLLSEWRAESEISQINAAAGGDPVAVSEETFAVVKAGVDVSRWSEGAFDLSWAALRGIYDFRPETARVPQPDELEARLPLIRWQDIALDEEARTVSLRREGMAIGTGGIAKGYALDRAAAILSAAGIESFMLFGGGQVQVRGPRGDRPWRVGIQHPRRAEDYFAFLEVEGVSISTSGDYEHVIVDDDGKRWHHILDPRTGLPAERSVSVTLLAPTGLYADALSTALFVMGPERGLAMLRGLPFEARAAILDAGCQLHTSQGMREAMQFRMVMDGDRLPGCGR
ncbi:MAG: FAD:protein FMN transferase [Myxococcales bacterium]|nr:FAD:protein FMN transferase [Myxococcales bacterium]